eukprot:635180-Pleurochrysis_carterae.AAC.1
MSDDTKTDSKVYLKIVIGPWYPAALRSDLLRSAQGLTCRLLTFSRAAAAAAAKGCQAVVTDCGGGRRVHCRYPCLRHRR